MRAALNKSQVNVWLGREDLDRLDALAHARGQSRSDAIKEALRLAELVRGRGCRIMGPDGTELLVL